MVIRLIPPGLSCLPYLVVLLSVCVGVMTPAAASEYLQFLEEEAKAMKVSTASKRLEDARGAPGVVTVITKEMIKDYGATSLVDVLNRAPGFQMMSSHLWVQAKAVLRGDLLTHADNQILLLINGRPFRDAAEANSNFALYSAFPVELIERVEIVRGPGSVLYGSNAVAGVINLITVMPPTDQEVRLTGGAGSCGTRWGSAAAFLSGDEWRLVAGARAYRESGWDFRAATNHPALGIARSETRYGESHHSVTAVYQRGRASVQAFVADLEYDDLGVIPDWRLAGQVGGQRTYLGVGYGAPLPAGWELKTNIDLNGWALQLTDQATGRSEYHSIAGVLEVSAAGSWGAKTNLVLGGLSELRANYDIIESIPGVQTPPIPNRYNERHESVYLQADHRMTSSLKIIGGVQYNRSDVGTSALVPRAGVLYDFTDALSAKILYGQAFRTATPLEEYISLPGVLIGAPDLDPERVTTFDAQGFLRTSRSQFVVTYFHNRYRDLIERVDVAGGSGAQTFQNAGGKTVQGIEVEESTRLTERVSLLGSATIQTERGGTLLIPGYMVKGGVSYRAGPLSGGLFHSHFGRPKSNTPIGGLTLNPPASAINLLSLNVNYALPFAWPSTLTFYGTNLLNDDMWYPEFSKQWVNTLPIGPGRGVYATYRVTF